MKTPAEALAPFPAWSVTLASPLGFPREPFSTALMKHAELLTAQAERIVHLARELATSVEPHLGAVDLCAIIEMRDTEGSARVELRGDAASYLSRCRGVLQQLLLRPLGDRMPVAVVGWSVVSLHMGRLEKRSPGSDDNDLHFVIESRELVVEPLGQEHTRSERGHVLITRWRHPDREDRYAWVPLPPEPASDEEAIDRVLARYDVLIHQRLGAFLADSDEDREPLLLVMSVRAHGDGLDISDRRECGPLINLFPKIARVIHGPRHDGYIPVVVVLGLTAGLRWFPLESETAPEPPPPMMDAMDLPAPSESRLPDVPPPEASVARKRRSPGEMFQIILRQGICSGIEEWLGRMTNQEVDAEIAMAGFDPQVERSRGPGLRESVLHAILDRHDGAASDAS